MVDDQAKTETQANPTVEREPTDVSVRAILWFLAALVVGGVVIHGIMWWVTEAFSARERAAGPPVPALAARDRVSLPRDLTKIPPPRLETSSWEVLKDVRDYEAKATSTYGWIDRDAGIVRIPVDRAMELVLQENRLPVRQVQPPEKKKSEGGKP